MWGLSLVTMITKRILLVNSEPNLREVEQNCLSLGRGWQVLTANSPTEGLLSAVQDQPDAILFDMATFGMNFLTFLHRLRAQADTQAIPVVLIAAQTKWLDTELFQQLGCAGVIEYSPDPAQLHQKISALLNW